MSDETTRTNSGNELSDNEAHSLEGLTLGSNPADSIVLPDANADQTPTAEADLTISQPPVDAPQETPDTQPVADQQDLSEAVKEVENLTINDSALGDVDDDESTDSVSDKPSAATNEVKDQEKTHDKQEPKADHSSKDLSKVKEEALAELAPIVDQLDLEPQDKYDLIVKIIHQTKNKQLLSKAHVAAKEISNDKSRAKALIEIINHIDG